MFANNFKVQTQFQNNVKTKKKKKSFTTVYVQLHLGLLTQGWWALPTFLMRNKSWVGIPHQIPYGNSKILNSGLFTNAPLKEQPEKQLATYPVNWQQMIGQKKEHLRVTEFLRSRQRFTNPQKMASKKMCNNSLSAVHNNERIHRIWRQRDKA